MSDDDRKCGDVSAEVDRTPAGFPLTEDDELRWTACVVELVSLWRRWNGPLLEAMALEPDGRRREQMRATAIDRLSRVVRGALAIRGIEVFDVSWLFTGTLTDEDLEAATGRLALLDLARRAS